MPSLVWARLVHPRSVNVMTETRSLLHDKTVFITGASRGIGAATARRLAGYGAKVALFARNEGRLAELAKSLASTGHLATYSSGDIRSFGDVASAMERAASKLGSIDIVINNAGIIDPIARLEASEASAWAQVIEVNVLGVFNGTRAAIPHLEERGGTIINLSSGAANSTLEGWSHYCVSKAAAKKFTECADKELQSLGIRVIGLSPGTVATDMMRSIRDSKINPVSQLDWDSHASPEWAAEAIAYLCTSAGQEHAGGDFSIKTDEGRRRVEAFVQANSGSA